MKMRTINHLTADIAVILSILVLIAVLTGAHTLFGTIAASIGLAVSLGMYLRVVVGTAALQVADKQEKLIRFAVAQKNDPTVVRQFADWVARGDMEFEGAQIADLCTALDEEGNRKGFWLLMVGSQSTYESIKRKLKNTTVLDYWPIDPKTWCENLMDTLANDDDFAEDAIPELKG